MKTLLLSLVSLIIVTACSSKKREYTQSTENNTVTAETPKTKDTIVANDPDKLPGANTYVNPADGKTYSTEGEFKKYKPEGGTKKYDGPVQPTGLVLLTNQNDIPRIIGIRELADVVKGMDAIVMKELAQVKEQGRIVIQCTLYDNKSAKMSLAFEGKLKRDDLGKVYKQMETYCKKQKTKQDSCTFQNIYQINNFKAGTK
ncbi:hypothetical protein BKI52_18380 [marine bacterium AO1-C]|nr:hypothetical protein BKI52_18380 [marine bacterium AO1-C]